MNMRQGTRQQQKVQQAKLRSEVINILILCSDISQGNICYLDKLGR